MSFNKSRGGGLGAGGDELVLRGSISKKWTFLLCLGSFCIGLLFTNRYAPPPPCALALVFSFVSAFCSFLQESHNP